MSGWDAFFGAVVGAGAATGGGAVTTRRAEIRRRRLLLYDEHLPAISRFGYNPTSRRDPAVSALQKSALRNSRLTTAKDAARVRDVTTRLNRVLIAAEALRAIDESDTPVDQEERARALEMLTSAQMSFVVRLQAANEWLERRLAPHKQIPYARAFISTKVRRWARLPPRKKGPPVRQDP